MKNKFVSSVRKFVKALDECNFDEAGRFLASRCRYLMGQNELIGPEAILRSYAGNAKWAAETLERVVYESEIEKILHQDIPGEPEALKEFLERCGIQRT